jgi:glycopeptide antibiotics resistance protein
MGFRDHLVDKSAGIITIVISIFLILHLTLSPYNFSFEDMFTICAHSPFILECGKFNYVDILNNCLLFIPLGFGLTSFLIRSRMLSGLAILGIIFLISFVISYFIEVLQVFLLSRNSSLIDVFSNSIGGLCGYICFYLLKYNNIQLLWNYNNVQFILLGYVTVAFLVSIPFQLKTSLCNWDESFPLLLGNERTADRPWQGRISDVYIADRALSEAEVTQAFSAQNPPATTGDSLLAFYRLTGRGSYPDAMDRQPELVWQGNSQDRQHDAGVLLGPNQWLKTVTPVTSLTHRLMQTSQFTLGVTVSTHDTQQTGPARIVSLSDNPLQRNFTLGQQGHDLVFRLRTPLTGDNGTEPELRVPGVFATTAPIHLVSTYDGAKLRVYSNGVRTSRTLELTPGAAIIQCFFPLDTFTMRAYKVLYYAIIFVPISLLLSRTVTRLHRRFPLQILGIGGSILFAALLLESLLVSVSGRNIAVENLLLSLLFMLAPLGLFKFFRNYFPCRLHKPSRR